MMWEILITITVVASVCIPIHIARTKARDAANLENLKRLTREAREREARRLSSINVRPSSRVSPN